MSIKTRIQQLFQHWNDLHPNASDDECKSAHDKIVGHVTRELMQGHELPLDLGTLV